MPANAMRPEAIHLQKANRQQQKYFFHLDAMQQTTIRICSLFVRE
jgi:hypothetical protein